MITEGLIALVWAAVSAWFFFDGGAAEVGSDLTAAAPTVVTKVSEGWLGLFGGILALLGVVAAPITSGDTALRSARLIIADALKFNQKPVKNRLMISLPIFLCAALLLWFNIADQNGFNTVWRYFGWANQALSVFTLWAVTVYLTRARKGSWYLITLIPAAFMTAVCLTFILVDKVGLGLSARLAPWIGLAAFSGSIALYYLLKNHKNQ